MHDSKSFNKIKQSILLYDNKITCENNFFVIYQEIKWLNARNLMKNITITLIFF